MFSRLLRNYLYFTFMFLLVCAVSFLLNVKTTSARSSVKPETPEIINTSTDNFNIRISVKWTMPSDAQYDGFRIYRSLSENGPYTLKAFLDNSYYTDYDTTKGVTYYYKIVSVIFDKELSQYIESEPVYTGKCSIPLEVPVITGALSGNSHSITITWNTSSYCHGYAIYRSSSVNGIYGWVKNVTSEFNGWNYSQSFTEKDLPLGDTYYYKIRPYITYNGTTFYGTFSNYKYAQVTINSTKVKSAISKKKATNTIKWKKNEEADGYMVYFSKKYNDPYKKLKTLKGNGKLTFTHKKLKNGTAYFYKIIAYKNYKGKKLSAANAPVYEKYCDYYTYKNESYENKYKRIFGNSKKRYYTSSKKAKKNMRTVRVKVWDIRYKKKYARKYYLTVHKNLVPSIRKMFKEIYKSKERFPIHDIGCYSWRGKGSVSEHCIGTAFDINSNENYMIEDGRILAGSFWRPRKNKYSIPLKCSLVKILEKYGFSRGFWGNRKDYMHFSYFGT